MRDKTELPTDFYLPAQSSEKLPCILVRTPSGKDNFKEIFTPLAQAGYVNIAIQDTRSHIELRMERLFLMLAMDGVTCKMDTTLFLGYQIAPTPMAKSALSDSQRWASLDCTMAPTNPCGLKCQYIGMAVGSLYHHAIYVGGQLLKNQVEGWLGLHAS